MSVYDNKYMFLGRKFDPLTMTYSFAGGISPVPMEMKIDIETARDNGKSSINELFKWKAKLGIK